MSKKSTRKITTARKKSAAGKNGSEKLPPAYFLSLELENVRCFGPKQTLDLSDGNGRPARWTVILGDNGVGKTTILQCLAMMYPPVLNRSKPAEIETVTPTVFHLAFNVLGTSNAQLFRSTEYQIALRSSIFYGHKLDGFRKGRTTEILYKVLPNKIETRLLGNVYSLISYGYGATRRMGSASLTDKNSDDTTASLFDNDARLINAEEWLLQADYSASKQSTIQEQAKRRRDQIKELLINLLPDVEDIEFTQPDEKNPRPGIRVKTPYGFVSMQDLSLGYKTLIAWMVDFASRMFDRYPESDNPIAEPAVVLVDEIDLHLHPRWQRSIMSFLTERFTNTQFIVTAHSPLVVQAASNANIALLKREGDHVVIDNEPESIRGWRVDQVLTSDLFGLESARPMELDALLEKRNKLLSKARLTDKDKEELRKLEEQIGPLPAGETLSDARAMNIITQAAKLLEKKGPRAS